MSGSAEQGKRSSRRTVVKTPRRRRRGQRGRGRRIAMANGPGALNERISGYEEVPALSTPGRGTFSAWVNEAHTAIHWRRRSRPRGRCDAGAQPLRERDERRPRRRLPVTNLGNGHEGTGCAPPAAARPWRDRSRRRHRWCGCEGRGAGGVRELITAIRAGATYVNMHAVGHPPGENRAQLGERRP